MMTVLRFLSAWAWTMYCSFQVLIWSLWAPRKAWLSVTQNWARVSLELLNIRVHVEGAEKLSGPAIFVCNHESLIDIVAVPAITPRSTKWVAKREIRYVPVLGIAFGRTGAVYINRQVTQEAVSSLREGVGSLPEGWSIAIFPEGTRSKDGSIKRFKKGFAHLAMQTGLPIVPVGLAGARDTLASGGWMVREGDIYFTVGDAIDTSDWVAESIEDHIAQTRAAVSALVAKSREQRSAMEPKSDTLHAMPDSHHT